MTTYAVTGYYRGRVVRWNVRASSATAAAEKVAASVPGFVFNEARCVGARAKLSRLPAPTPAPREIRLW